MITKMYVNVSTFLATYKNDERGVTAIEYGLIGVAMASMLGVVFSSTDGAIISQLTDAYDQIAASIAGVYTAPASGS